MIGALICLFLPESLTSRVHVTFLGLYKFTPSLGRSIPLAAVASPISLKNQDDEQLRRYKQLELEKDKLENHLANVSAELAAEHAKADSLSAMRSRFPGLSGAGLIDADVITSLKGGRQRIMINRGEIDGLRKGQYVLALNSVIGQVDETSSRTAFVKLVTDKDSLMGVEIAGSKTLGAMKGTGRDFAAILPNKNSRRANKGDIVYTYKNPGLLDVPMIVGKVAQCKPDDEHPLLWDITVTPVVKIEDIVSVTIVVMNPSKQE